MKQMVGGVNYIAKSTEPKFTTGVRNGETLYLVDTGEEFIFYDGDWWRKKTEVINSPDYPIGGGTDVPNAFTLSDGSQFLVRDENGSSTPFLYAI